MSDIANGPKHELALTSQFDRRGGVRTDPFTPVKPF
jgi:hypothetical protein